MSVRTAQKSDADAIAEAHVASWREAYKGIISDEGLASLSVPERAVRWREALTRPNHMILVAEDQGCVVGFAALGASRDEDKDPATTGEIGAIYLEPSAWGKGLGRQLLSDSLKLLHSKGYEQVTLWVLERNGQARRFYEKAGFSPDGASVRDRIRGTDVVKVRYVLRLEGL